MPLLKPKLLELECPKGMEGGTEGGRDGGKSLRSISIELQVLRSSVPTCR